MMNYLLVHPVIMLPEGEELQCKDSYFRGVRIFCTCSVLSLGGKVNTRRMSQPEMGSFT